MRSDPLSTEVSGQWQQAIAHYQTGRWADAASICQQMVQQNPSHAAALHLLGAIAYANQQLDTAIAYYQQALAAHPNSAEFHNHLAVVLDEVGQHAEAIAHYHQALVLDADYAEAWQNLGTTYQSQAQIAQAIKCYQRALAIKPNSANAYNNWGSALRQAGRFAEALTAYNRAIAFNPNHVSARCGRADIWLRLGALQQGFEEYEWRWYHVNCPSRNLPQPLWDGSAFPGKTLLLYTEQGLGDTIQFIRYLPLVRERGDRILLELNQPGLERLLSHLDGLSQIVLKGEPLPPFDLQAPLMSLPRIFNTTLTTIPAEVPYLQAPQNFQLPHQDESEQPKSGQHESEQYESEQYESEQHESKQPALLKVGIVWIANLQNSSGRDRSCPLTLLQPILDIPNIKFYSLQKEVSDGDRTLLYNWQIPDLGTQFQDLADTAAAIAQLDRIITVDTMTAHLAGALNKTVWVLLPFLSDWRWLYQRSDSPWYPSMRLFRQSQPQHWEAVIQDIVRSLSQDSLGRRV